MSFSRVLPSGTHDSVESNDSMLQSVCVDLLVLNRNCLPQEGNIIHYNNNNNNNNGYF